MEIKNKSILVGCIILVATFKKYHCWPVASQNHTLSHSISGSLPEYSSPWTFTVTSSTNMHLHSTIISGIAVSIRTSTYNSQSGHLRINQTLVTATKHTTSTAAPDVTTTSTTLRSVHVLPSSKSISSPTKTSGTKTPTIVHKVGLIVGVVCGLVILALCLIIFHKKEARLWCLKMLCKPCTKNYSRYNIVPIYVYDDVEQDIRELEDNSDLPIA